MDDIGGTFDALRERGVTFRDRPHRVHRMENRELWLSFFEDGEDNVFAIRTWKAVAGA